MNAVILGYGVVGKGIEILTNSLEDINIKYVYVRKEKENLPYMIELIVSMLLLPPAVYWIAFKL